MSGVELTLEEILELKNVLLAKKQGEALERGSTPLNFDEAVSLGHFGPPAAYALSLLESHQDFIESLTGYKGTILKRFVETISRATGSIQAKRLEQTFDAVGRLGQYRPMEGFSGDLEEESDEGTSDV